MWVWYKNAVDRPPPPAIVDLTIMTAEREGIYRHVTCTGETIPVGDITFSVDDVIPEDEDIAWAVRRLRLK